MTQKRLAELLSVSIITVSAWENRRRGIPPMLSLALKWLESQEK